MTVDEVDPRYHKTQAVIELLDIASEEEREMRTQFGAEEKRRRYVSAGDEPPEVRG